MWTYHDNSERMARRYSYFNIAQRVVVEDFNERGEMVRTREFIEFADAAGKGTGVREIAAPGPLPV
jgi:hypothetical protein